MRRPDKAFVRFHERNGLHSGLRGDGLPVGGHEAREFLEPSVLTCRRFVGRRQSCRRAGGAGRAAGRVAVGVGSRQLPGAAPFELVDDDLDVACDASHVGRIVTRILRWHRPRRRDLVNRLARRVTGPDDL